MAKAADTAKLAVTNGATIAFMGDSITQIGAGPVGYVSLVIAGLKSAGLNVKAIPAGISGHKSNNMLERLQSDVIDKKPDWMTLSCGVNDVWHGANGIPLEQYRANISNIVERAQSAGIKVMILTATMIMENADNDLNKKLAPYNVFLRELAKEKNCLLADLNADMQAAIKAADPEIVGKFHVLTADGVHMAPLGDMLMARGVLRAFGMSADQLSAAEEAWKAMSFTVTGATPLTLADYMKLCDLAARQKMNAAALLNRMLQDDIQAAVAP
ncbi:MAG: GDSL-type esterase/lipase family protein [Kiritimatiellae bacterium]|nr:GDSL-type esterase/lipase family protein [Kiritimatiellia bacterium]